MSIFEYFKKYVDLFQGCYNELIGIGSLKPVKNPFGDDLDLPQIDNNIVYNTLDNEGCISYDCENSLIKDIVSRAKEYYLKNYSFLQNFDIFLDYDSFEYYFPMYIHKNGLQPLGIKKMALHCDYDTTEYIYVNFELLPIYESLVLGNYILEVCMDDIIKEMSKVSMYSLYKKNVFTVGDMIYSDGSISQLTSINQLISYIQEVNANELYLIKGNLKPINVSYDLIKNADWQIPATIDLEITLEKIWCNQGYQDGIDDFFIKRMVQFQITKNIDWSLSLVPQPNMVQNVILEQFNLWSQWTKYVYNNWWFVPNALLPLIRFMIQYNYKGPYGYVKDVVDNKKALEMTIKYDNDEYDSCFIGDVQMFRLPAEKLSDFIYIDYSLVLLSD